MAAPNEQNTNNQATIIESVSTPGQKRPLPESPDFLPGNLKQTDRQTKPRTHSDNATSTQGDESLLSQASDDDKPWLSDISDLVVRSLH